VLKDFTLDHLNYILEYIYLGTCNIPVDEVDKFKSALHALGIDDDPEDEDTDDHNIDNSEDVERVEEEVPGDSAETENDDSSVVIKTEPEWDDVVVKEEPAVKQEGLLKIRTPASINENVRVKLNEFNLKNLKLVAKLPVTSPTSSSSTTTLSNKPNIQELSQRLSKAILIRRVLKSDGSVVSQRRPIQIIQGMKIQKISPVPIPAAKSCVFRCGYCNKAFAVNKRRNAHQKYCFRNPQRPSSQCPYCPMVLCNPTYIQTHIRKVHGVDENGEQIT
jgi:hypothetical protein